MANDRAAGALTAASGCRHLRRPWRLPRGALAPPSPSARALAAAAAQAGHALFAAYLGIQAALLSEPGAAALAVLAATLEQLVAVGHSAFARKLLKSVAGSRGNAAEASFAHFAPDADDATRQELRDALCERLSARDGLDRFPGTFSLFGSAASQVRFRDAAGGAEAAASRLAAPALAGG